jgi:hypothetical protein
MRDHRVRRWFAAGIAGTLFAIIMLALAAPVAADGNTLVTLLPGQDPNAPIQVVASPGFVNNGTATNPITTNVINAANGNVVCTANACYPVGTVCTTVNCGFPVYGGGCTIYGCVAAGCTVNGCIPTVNGACSVYGCGTLGYTAAGPIVGVDNNGNPIVYDVRGGGYDTYTRGPNGLLCEADSSGNCQKGTPGNP